MWLANVDMGALVAIVALAIPIVAIVGGITAGIIRTLGRQRLVELAQRERIAAIERGMDPSKLAPLPVTALDDEPETWSMSQYDRDRRRAQRLMISGIITMAVGLSVMLVFSVIEDHDEIWVFGIIPAAVGVALLLSSFLVRPRKTDHTSGPSTMP